MPETIDISLAPAGDSESDGAPGIMKQPLSESVCLVVARQYGNQKSRVQYGADVSHLLHNARDPGAILLAELSRLRSLLDAKENALKRKESGA